MVSQSRSVTRSLSANRLRGDLREARFWKPRERPTIRVDAVNTWTFSDSNPGAFALRTQVYDSRAHKEVGSANWRCNRELFTSFQAVRSEQISVTLQSHANELAPSANFCLAKQLLQRVLDRAL